MLFRLATGTWDISTRAVKGVVRAPGALFRGIKGSPGWAFGVVKNSPKWTWSKIKAVPGWLNRQSVPWPINTSLLHKYKVANSGLGRFFQGLGAVAILGPFGLAFAFRHKLTGRLPDSHPRSYAAAMRRINESRELSLKADILGQDKKKWENKCLLTPRGNKPIIVAYDKSFSADRIADIQRGVMMYNAELSRMGSNIELVAEPAKRGGDGGRTVIHVKNTTTPGGAATNAGFAKQTNIVGKQAFGARVELNGSLAQPQFFHAVLHEFGHCFGRDHVANNNAMMGTQATGTCVGFSNEDRRDMFVPYGLAGERDIAAVESRTQAFLKSISAIGRTAGVSTP